MDEYDAEQCLTHDECPICLDEINNAHITECNHTFCHDCIYNPGIERIVSVINDVTVVGISCPLCRRFIILDELIETQLLLDKIIFDTCCKLIYISCGIITSFGTGILIGGTLTQVILNENIGPASVILSGMGGMGVYTLSYLYPSYRRRVRETAG